MKAREGVRDLDVRIALTNTYRHLFYAMVDTVKAPKGLMHYTLPSHDSSIVKGKNNQQDVILKALKDCTKIRSEEANAFAPAYILQKVWPSGLDSWTTKAFRDEFAKNLNLNLLLDAEVAKLRETIRRGLQEGQWDLKIGERLYIKTDDSPLTPPDTLEFSDRMVLYRRGILQPPEPKIIELNAQLMPSTEALKPVRLRWKAKGAVTVQLYQDGGLIPGEFRPSDEYETQIDQTTLFRLVVDYGNGEIQEKETTVKLVAGTNLTVKNGGGIYGVETVEIPTIFDYQSPIIELEGTVNSVFTKLMDSCSDRKVQSIESLEIMVSQFVDYRKLGTAISLLSRFKLQIDQRATIQVGDQFVRVEYQGPVKGFQPFFTPLNALLNSSDVQGNISFKLTIEFQPAILPHGTELNQIQQQLNRNPVDRLNLTAKVNY